MVDALIDQWDGWTEHQRALDIEYLFGWNPAFWNAKAWTIAVGEGLFTHVERAEHVEVRMRSGNGLLLVRRRIFIDGPNLLVAVKRRGNGYLATFARFCHCRKICKSALLPT